MTDTIAIIDLGSNTTRMVIYRYVPGHFFYLEEEVREVVRLREGMGDTPVLRAASMERSLRAMRMFRTFCDTMGIDDIIMTATSAVRDAGNGDTFLARVEAEARFKPWLLSGELEGYYGALGAINATGLREGFVVDLGGGSAQIVEVRGGLPQRCVSLPLGALRLSELFLGYDQAAPDDVAALQAYIAAQLGALDWFQARPADRLVAVGGTIRNLARIDQANRRYPLDLVHAYVFDGSRLRGMADQMWRMSREERGALAVANRDRADILQSGALVYDALLAHSGFDRLTISRQGLREGIFYERFLAGQAQPVIEDLRRFSVLNLARKFDHDNAHSRHVTALSLRLFDELAPAHKLDSAYRELLWAAGMLHDIGTAVDFFYHHHHSSYILLYSGLPGYSHRELALIALLTRYHRKGNPTPGRWAALLGKRDRRALRILAAMLRLAEFLERGRSQVVRDLRCFLNLANGWVQIETLAVGDASIEIWDARRNLGLLEEALGLEVELVEGMWLAQMEATAA